MIKTGDSSTVIFNHTTKANREEPKSATVVEVWPGETVYHPTVYRVMVVGSGAIESYMVIECKGSTRRIFVEA